MFPNVNRVPHGWASGEIENAAAQNALLGQNGPSAVNGFLGANDSPKVSGRCWRSVRVVSRIAAGNPHQILNLNPTNGFLIICGALESVPVPVKLQSTKEG